MTTPIESLGFDDLANNFNNVLQADTLKPLALTPGSVLGAFRNAAAFNDLFIQAKGIEVALAGRLDTCLDVDLDSYVGQFVPPFVPRLPAVQATSAPLAPTTLAASALATYLWVNSIVGLQATQTLRVTNGLKGASTSITTIEPVTLLTLSVTNGATSLTVGSTAGMFVNQVLQLSYNGFTTNVTVLTINSATQVATTAVSPASVVTFVGGAATVKLTKTLLVAAFTLDAGTLLTDLVTGSTVRATSLIQGVIFSRRAATASAVLIPVGTVITTPTTGIAYTVVADVTNPDYVIASNGYFIPANGTQVYVPIKSVLTGTSQNVLANTLTVISTAVSGVDLVTNPYATVNGGDQETDDVLKARFRNFMTGRASGTMAAIKAAIQSVSTILQFNVIENVANDGITFQPGNFVVTAGDNNGLLTSDMYTLLYSAIDAARAITTTFLLQPPVILQPIILLVLSVKERADLRAATIRTNVQTALYNSFNATPAGTVLYFNKLIELAMDQDGVVDVVRCTVNGNGFDTSSGAYVIAGTGPAPYTATAFQFIRPPLANVQVS